MSVRALTTLATVIALFTLAGDAGAKTLPIEHSRQTAAEKKPDQSKKATTSKLEARKQAQLRTSAKQVGELRQIAWDCQDKLIAAGGLAHRTKASTSIWAMPPSVTYRLKFVAPHWIKIAKECQKTLVTRTIPSTNDWITAVNLVQRIYPGTADWLKFISHREGGWGGFVMNHQGSGAGGWMQYMASTYYAYNDAAYADARRRGFIIDERTNQWTHPLGQAITAGYMRYTHRDACHWCL